MAGFIILFMRYFFFQVCVALRVSVIDHIKHLQFVFNQSKEECEYLINLAKPHMQKSTVVDGETGRSKDSRYAYCC